MYKVFINNKVQESKRGASQPKNLKLVIFWLFWYWWYYPQTLRGWVVFLKRDFHFTEVQI